MKTTKGFLVIFMCNHCPYVKAKVDALNDIENLEKILQLLESTVMIQLTIQKTVFDAMKETAKGKDLVLII